MPVREYFGKPEQPTAVAGRTFRKYYDRSINGLSDLLKATGFGSTIK